MNLGNVRIGWRLAIAFGTLLALLVAIALVGLGRMSAIGERLDEVVRVNIEQLENVAEMRTAVMETAIANRNIALSSDKSVVQSAVERIKKQRQVFLEAQADMQRIQREQGGASEQQKKLLATVAEMQVALAPKVEKAMEMGVANNPETNDYLLQEVLPLQRKIIDALAELAAGEKRDVMADAQAAKQTYDTAVVLTIGLSLAALLAGLGLAWLTTRGIVRPLGQALVMARTVAAGDLSTQVEVRTQDESGQLMRALNDMNTSLARIVGQVREGTDTMATASAQIAAGNQDLSQRTEEQAASLEETAASMEQLTGTVKQNADNARQANQLAQSASEVAAQGGSVVGEVVDTMGAINESSRKIADIIGVIDGIAFQTNILALNAAVEAARAGEQGRGFAVVAAEVRSLAQRSAAAAKEIKALIDDSVGKVDAGSALVHKAGATMQEVVGSIKRVTDIMGEIAAASQEQTAGIEQVNRAITQMEQVTQQNAALVEEASAAAQSMREQAGSLVQAVSAFTLGADQSAAAAIARAKAAPRSVPAHAAAPRAGTAPAAPATRAGTALAAGRGGEGDWKEF